MHLCVCVGAWLLCMCVHVFVCVCACLHVLFGCYYIVLVASKILPLWGGGRSLAYGKKPYQLEVINTLEEADFLFGYA